ncbi:MAG TPA: hypothetical protein VN256_18360 [Pyrinomonadaceae bacterium]|nr:hypothetical protein [Pyrinomonadaceae bacterium]
MANGKWTKAVSIHHLRFAGGRFPLAFAPLSLYHVRLLAFVRRGVRGRQIFGQFFKFLVIRAHLPLLLAPAS